MVYSRIWLLVCVTLLYHPYALGNESTSSVRMGWDWSLPDSDDPVPYSGFITWGGTRFDSQVNVSGIHVSWRKLNPERGKYDWQYMRERIEANHRQGLLSGIHLLGTELNNVPEWVVKEFNPSIIDVTPSNVNQPWRIKNVAVWHREVEQAYLDFLKEFGSSGIPQSENVVYAYIHGISPSRGEELWFRKMDEKLYRDFGLSAGEFVKWMMRRADAMLNAFKGVEYKLAWMSPGPIGQTNEWQVATRDLWAHVRNRGAGIRGGGIDFAHQLFEAVAWSSRLIDGYSIVDDTDSTIVGGRFRGDENEEYGQQWEWRFGPLGGHSYRHRISSLRALQMRQNFEVVSPATLALNPELNNYVRLSLGRHREDSLDAWAYLRQCRVRYYDGPVKNIERWLIQRDVAGSRSVQTERVDRYPMPQDVPGIHFDYDARRTDLANGQDGLAFRVDKVFWSKAGPAEVKVTYTDRSSSVWRLITTDSRGAVVRSVPIENTGDGKVKTATFHVEELACSGAFPGEMDFRLVSEGPGDLIVTFVRVLRGRTASRSVALLK